MALPHCRGSARVDDVERLPEAGQIALFNAYNELRERGGALVAAGDAPPVQLPLRADLVTRLGWGSSITCTRSTTRRRRRRSPTKLRTAASISPGLHGLPAAARPARHGLARRDARCAGSLFLAAKRPVTLPLVRELVREQSTENESNNAPGTL